MGKVSATGIPEQTNWTFAVLGQPMGITFASRLTPRRQYTAGSKNRTLGKHVVLADTKSQQCRCIIFEDINIFLSAIFIFGPQILYMFQPPHTPH